MMIIDSLKKQNLHLMFVNTDLDDDIYKLSINPTCLLITIIY